MGHSERAFIGLFLPFIKSALNTNERQDYDVLQYLVKRRI
jgi:hypothetical protein